MKYQIITFGCQMNKSDSQRIASVLEKQGHSKTSKTKKADLVVVNMCSVRQSAVDRVYGLVPKLKKLKKEKPELKTVLTGCVLPKDLKKFKKSFDFTWSIKTLPLWPDFLKKNTSFCYPLPRDSKFYQKFNLDYLHINPSRPHRYSVFIPIMSGCNNFCSFCAVPYTRGPEIYRPAKEILEETKEAISRGAKEIWLLGQNVNSYLNPKNQKTKKGEPKNFSELLEMVDNLSGNFWIRFTSSHPKDFSDELIKTIKECKKVTEYLNLPVQSGDDQILKKMNRPYTAKYYKKLIKKIKKEIPHIFLSTDVIVGFPGETKKQFENTKRLFEQVKYDMAYISKYSPRSNTLAARKYEDTVSEQEKNRREKVLTNILKKTAHRNNQKYVGKTVKTLINHIKKKEGKSFAIGKTRTYRTIKTKVPPNTSNNLVGEFVEAKVTKAVPWGLKGIIV